MGRKGGSHIYRGIKVRIGKFGAAAMFAQFWSALLQIPGKT